MTQIDRRRLIAAAAIVTGGALLAPRPASAAQQKTYDEAARETWAPLRPDGGTKELVRFATLAANSHNTQPWLFSVAERRVTIVPDLSRRCPAVDPDDHHLFASLGCAAENLVQAASAMGFATDVTFADDKLTIALEPAPHVASPLVAAIPQRQCTRAPYDGKAVETEKLRLLESAGAAPEVSLLLLTDRTRMAAVTEYVLQANSAQMQDKAFMDELKAWMRFNRASAVATMDGLYAPASGNPALPTWLARTLLPFVFKESTENEKYATSIASSAGVAVFAAAQNDKAHWVAAGRACQRFALQATALGLKYAFINQPVEVPRLRGQFATYLGLGDQRPDLVVRFGAGPELPRALRRPVESVLI